MNNMKCIIYIQTKDLQAWNEYMWNLRTNEPSLPPGFRTMLDTSSKEAKLRRDEWIQMIIEMDDLQRIYDMMDEYATMVEKFQTN
jgi:hypothetical protein